ncbi:unnamed protein product [Urochloa humidicola]
MASPPDLPDDVIAEILVRLPQDDPSSLLRASLACKAWFRIATGPDFRRRLGSFHQTPPLLGFLRDSCSRPRSSFTATTACPRPPSPYPPSPPPTGYPSTAAVPPRPRPLPRRRQPPARLGADDRRAPACAHARELRLSNE